jgi:limonene-1,2-epoxide hydrolase
MRQIPGAVVAAFIRAIESRQFDNAKPYLAPDVTFDNVPQKPPAKITIGRDAVAARLQKMLTACIKTEWQIIRQIEQGDTVFNERIDRFWFAPGTFPKSDLLEWPVCGRWDVVNGQITLWRDYYELALTKPQLGVSLTDYAQIVAAQALINQKDH